MKITKIAKIGKADKFAIFIEGKLNLVVSADALLSSGITVGDDLSEGQVTELNSANQDSTLYSKALKYLNIRIRSEGEMIEYLKKKGSESKQISSILERLKELDLINDDRYVRAYIHDRTLQAPASKRKILYELKKKKIAEDVIERSINNDQISDATSLKKLIEIKRRQSKYKDDLKLMQYLVRNGFNYGDVKDALKESDN